MSVRLFQDFTQANQVGAIERQRRYGRLPGGKAPFEPDEIFAPLKVIGPIFSAWIKQSGDLIGLRIND